MTDISDFTPTTVGVDPDSVCVQSASGPVTPDMLYKLSKKIAQLTKVIYSLNTRNDDLESELGTMRSGHKLNLFLFAL